MRTSNSPTPEDGVEQRTLIYARRMRDIWILFFFSSRRRHTRLQGDWSSDVCSSDLEAKIAFEIPSGNELASRLDGVLQTLYLLFNEGYKASGGETLLREELCREAIRLKIGRASCRERV